MPIEGEYQPSPSQFVRDQVETYERTGGRDGNRMPPGESGWPIIILTTRGNRSGRVRKTPLMRVEHSGDYAVVASLGGAPKHPVWYYNIRSQPQVVLQDGPEPFDGIARELEGEERAIWVGACRRGIPAVRRLSAADPAADPGLPDTSWLTTTSSSSALGPLVSSPPICYLRSRVRRIESC
jgi:F420H(2)-dependent quinone reductase